jgi:hypothetical protein
MIAGLLRGTSPNEALDLLRREQVRAPCAASYRNKFARANDFADPARTSEAKDLRCVARAKQPNTVDETAILGGGSNVIRALRSRAGAQLRAVPVVRLHRARSKPVHRAPRWLLAR